MLHESGKASVFDIHLENLSKEEYEKLCDVIDRHAFITQQVPGKQVLRVFWNLVESPAEAFDLPPSSVIPVDCNTL